MGWEEDVARLDAEEAERIGDGDAVLGQARIRAKQLRMAEDRVLSVAAIADHEAKIKLDRRTCDPRDVRLIDAGCEELRPGVWRLPAQPDAAPLVTADEAHRWLAERARRFGEMLDKMEEDG